MSTVGDIMNTPGDTIINVEKVIGKTTEFAWKPHCTEYPPVYCADIMQGEVCSCDQL